MNLGYLPAMLIGIGIGSLLSTLHLVLTKEKTHASTARKSYQIKPLQKMAKFQVYAALLTGLLWTTSAAIPITSVTILLFAVLPISAIMQHRLLNWKKLQLGKAIRKNHIETSICGIEFELAGPTGIQFWIKPTHEEWPPARMEIAVDLESMPVTEVSATMINQLEPILKDIMESARGKSLMQQTAKKLRHAGIIHPIDIAGWDHNQITKKLVEQIFHPEPI